VTPGVRGERPDESATSRPRFQSEECLITAPSATSPSSCPLSPKRSTRLATLLTDMPKLPTSEYTVLLRQNGMRTPPMMPARRMLVVAMSHPCVR